MDDMYGLLVTDGYWVDMTGENKQHVTWYKTHITYNMILQGVKLTDRRICHDIAGDSAMPCRVLSY